MLEVETVEQARAQRATSASATTPITCMGPEATAADFADVTGARTSTNAPPPLPGTDAGALDYAALTADDVDLATATPAAPTATATAPAEPPPAPPLKRIEDSRIEVPQKEKIDTIAQVLSPEQAARLQSLAASSELSQESVDAAYASVLEARKTPGQKDLALHLTPMRKEWFSPGGDSDPYMQVVAGAPESFQAKMDVSADGRVNGKPLGVDELATLSSEIAPVGAEAKRAALEESGLGGWAGMSTEGQQEYALAKLRQAAGTPGTHNLDFSFTVRGTSGGDSETPYEFNVEGKVSLNVGADRTVNGGALPIERKLAEKIAFENKAWPAGAPEARERSRIEDVALDIPQSEKVAAIAQALSPEDAARMRAMVDTGKVPAAQIEATYASVLEARKTPGEKQLAFELNTMREETSQWGDSGPMTQLVPDPAVSFNAKMSVGADGSVNGAPLGVDQLARLSSQISTVPGEAKDAALREAGLSENWLATSTSEQKEYALAKLRQASLTPGTHEIDLSRTSEIVVGGESEYRTTHTEPGKISLQVGEDGKVNGKTPAIERALATTLVMEQLPMVEKRQMMAQLGIPQDAVDAASPQESSDLLARIALRTQTPGEQQFDMRLGGREYTMGLKIGPEGQIEGAGAAPKPPKPKSWKKWIGPILTIASFVFPPAAPFLQAANAALAVANGAKGLGLVAAVAGGFAGVAGGLANLGGAAGTAGGLASAASTASTIAQYAGAANGLYQGAKTGDWLGAIASGASLVGAIGGNDLGADLGTVQTVSQVAGYASRVVNGDFEGLLAEGIGRGIEASRTPTATQADVRRIDNAIDAAQEAELPASTFSVDFSGADVRLGDSGTSTVRLGTGDDGASIASEPTGPVAEQADVRRIDNEIRATQRTPTEVREDFDRQFAAARQQGQTTFVFDKDDGRGPLPYTTGTREEVAGSMQGGSTQGYRTFLTQSGLRDSDAGLAAYRQSLTPATPSAPLTFGTSFGADLGTGSFGLTGFDNSVFTTLGVPTAGGPVAAAADAGRALAASTDPTVLQRMSNGTVNTVGILNDSLLALVPGTDSNRAVTGAIVNAAKSMWNLGAQAINDPAGAAQTVERAVGAIVRTAMDPREWATAGQALVGEVLRPFGDLATTLAKDPDAIKPGELAIAAFGAATVFNPRGAARGVGAVVRSADDVSHTGTSALYSVANLPDLSRETSRSAAFFDAYKNDPSFATYVRSLPDGDQMGSLTGRDLLNDFRASDLQVTPSPLTFDLSAPAASTAGIRQFMGGEIDAIEPHLRVLNAATGDSVIARGIDGKPVSLTLDGFVGAGNSTHLFGVAGQPDAVVRLPFSSSALNRDASDPFSFNRQFVQERARFEGIEGLDVVGVRAHSANYEMVVVDRLPEGFRTLDSLADEAAGLQSRSRLTGAEQARLTELEGLFTRASEPLADIAERSGRLANADAIRNGTEGWGLAISSEGRQVALTPDNRLVLMDWEVTNPGTRVGGNAGGVANVVGRAREQDAASYFNRMGFDARVSNVEVNARFGGTEIDVDVVMPDGRYAVLVGADAKALRNNQIDEAAVNASLDRYYRARDAAIDPDGPYKNDGAGALMAFPAGTDPRVIARFEEALGRRNVIVFTPPSEP